jgi:N-sulfoglucosamine sulfohydrolase
MPVDAPQPNVLWISFEDTSPRFGCYGDSLARTPHIDKLASEGMRFQNAFSTAGVCSPSRCAIITGMYAPSIGAHHHRTKKPVYTDAHPTPYEVVPPAYVKLLPEYLRATGYFCTNNAKTDYQFNAPFTAWDENGNHAHWRNRNGDQPFFSVFNLGITHESGMWRDQVELLTNPDEVKLPPYLPNTDKSRKALALHYDNLEAADQMAGGLLRQLEEDGLADNTIVFIWSDHGEGIPRSKRWPYDSGTHVPLIVRWPGQIEPGTSSEQLVSMIDLAPTVLSLLGSPVPGHFHGQPFMGPAMCPRDYVYASRDRHDQGYDMVRAVRDSTYRYIRNYHPEKPYFDWVPYGHQHAILQEMWRLHAQGELQGPAHTLMADKRPVEELYDCKNDPHEIHNLAADPRYRKVLERMRQEQKDWSKRIGDMGDIPEERMVRMMWPDRIQPQTAPVQFVPIDEKNPGLEPANTDGYYQKPTLLMLFCATQGASIAYTLDEVTEGEEPRWSLYTAPFLLPEGKTVVRSKAVRIGFKPSEETGLRLTVTKIG